MLFLAVFVFPWCAFSYDTNHRGTFHISMLNNKSVYRKLKIHGDQLYVSDQVSFFDYDVRGTLALWNSALYLSVDSEGRLVLDARPHTGFLLTSQVESGSKRTLSYLGNSQFQVCSDSLVAYRSKCKWSSNITITFEDTFSGE